MRVSEIEGHGPSRPEVLEAPVAHPVADPNAGLQLLLVTWHDAWFDSDQQGPDEWRADYLVHTVGFLVRESPTILSIAQEILPDGDGFRAVTHIPVPTIDSITRLFPSATPGRRHHSGDGQGSADGNGNGRLH